MMVINRINLYGADLAKKCGISASRLHDARYSHASIMLKAGVHPRTVQERLGHSTIAITLDTYSPVSPGLQEVAAKRFDEAFSPNYNETVNKVDWLSVSYFPLCLLREASTRVNLASEIN